MKVTKLLLLFLMLPFIGYGASETTVTNIDEYKKLYEGKASSQVYQDLGEPNKIKELTSGPKTYGWKFVYTKKTIKDPSKAPKDTPKEMRGVPCDLILYVADPNVEIIDIKKSMGQTTWNIKNIDKIEKLDPKNGKVFYVTCTENKDEMNQRWKTLEKRMAE